jgi:alkaline phosphatase
MIEEAYTDKGAHNNEFTTVFNAVKRINNVAYYAIAFAAVHPDTVLLITADHETGGITLGSNGKYGFTVTSHTNSDVPVYGMGPGVDEFLSKDKVDNTDISKFIAKIYTSDKWGE